MKLLIAYVKQHKREGQLFLLFVLIFAAIFALYRLPLEAVFYPTVLCILVGMLFFITDFIRFKNKHKRLRELTIEMISALPAAENAIEEDYQAVIEMLQAGLAEFKSQADMHYQDMMEYYTVWVHQIKTPIASMQLTLQKEDSPLSRKLSRDLFRIEQYVEMVLAFLRLDSPSNDYVFGKCDLDRIIKQVIKRFAAEFIDRKLSLEYEPVKYQVVTDEKWLAFVMEQILSNALKYTHTGGIRIYMQGPNLCIQDTGIGIAAEDLPRIFEKGYTGYNGRADKKASGLGLYLCKRVCDGLGVGIHVISEPDQGTMVQLNMEQYHLTNL